MTVTDNPQGICAAADLNQQPICLTLPNGKIFDQSKLKAFADDEINVTKKLKFVKGRVEDIVGKGDNAGR